MTDLSPAAQAVLDAFGNTSNGEYIQGVWIVNEQAMLAAALRAAAERAGQVPAHPVNTDWEKGFADGARLVYRELLNIAAELEDAGAE